MLPQVIRQMFLSSETLLTELAAMWRITRVYSHVVIQMFLPGECLRAKVTPMGRLTGVLSNMIGQMFLSGERFGTILAFVWRFT